MPAMDHVLRSWKLMYYIEGIEWESRDCGSLTAAMSGSGSRREHQFSFPFVKGSIGVQSGRKFCIRLKAPLGELRGL